MKLYKILYKAEPNDYKRFKQWLKDNKLSQDEIAKKLDIFSSQLYAMITGKKTMNNTYIEQLKQLGYDVLGDNNGIDKN